MTWDIAMKTLAEHALKTLPDSISARKALLRSSLHVLSSKHPEYRRAMKLLWHLEKHEALQSKLPLHDGHLKHKGGKA